MDKFSSKDYEGHTWIETLNHINSINLNATALILGWNKGVVSKIIILTLDYLIAG